MRSFLRTRYGCDFCKKVGGSKPHMIKHEAGCTNNPNRDCSMHHIATGGGIQVLSVANLKRALSEGGFPFLKEAAENCPACILAGLRQSEWGEGAETGAWGQPVDDGRDAFDFKKAVGAMWDEHNANQESGHYSAHYS